MKNKPVKSAHDETQELGAEIVPGLKLSFYAFRQYGDAKLYNGIRDLERALVALEWLVDRADPTGPESVMVLAAARAAIAKARGGTL